MVKSRNESSSSDDIILEIKRGEITHLLLKLEKKLKSFENIKNDKSTFAKGEFLTRVLRYLCQYLSVKNDIEKSDLSHSFKCIEFCINNISKHYSPLEIKKIPNGQYERTWYHIIHHFLRGKHDCYAFLLINLFRNYIADSLKLQVDDSLFVLIDSTFSIVWDYLSKHEKFAEDEIFENKLLILQLLSLNPKQFRRFADNSTSALRAYCKSKAPSSNLISSFIKKIWTYVYPKFDHCSDICTKQLIFKYTTRWLNLIEQQVLNNVYEDFSAIFDFLLNEANTDCNKCCHSKLIETVSEIVGFCIKAISLKEVVRVSSLWEAQLKVDENNSEDFQYLSCAFNYFLIFLEKVRKHFFIDKVSICDATKDNLKVVSHISSLYMRHFQEDAVSSSLVDNRSFVITAMLQIVYCMMQQESDFRTVSDLLTFYTEKLNILYTMEEGNKNNGLESYVITLGNVAQFYMQQNLYSDAAYYFEFVTQGCQILFEKYVQFSLTEVDRWKYSKLLIMCYTFLELYDDALKIFIRAVSLKTNITISDFNLWIKIKKSAFKSNKDSKTVTKTVSDIISDMNVDILPDKELNLLKHELIALKKVKYYECSQEIIAVISSMLKLVSDPITEAWILVELSQVEEISLANYYFDICDCGTPLSLCQKATEIIKKQPDSVYCKIILSYCNFWMYIHNANEIHKVTSKDVEQENKSTKNERKSSTEDEETSEDDEDIKSAFCNVTLSLEHKCFENLHNAVKLWNDISITIENNADIVCELEQVNILDIMSATAEIFVTSGNENESLTVWSLIHKISHYSSNPYYKFSSLYAIIVAAIKNGYLNLAEKLMIFAEEIKLNITDENILNLYNLLLCYCKSLLFLHQENFTEGLKYLKIILECDTLKQNIKKFFIIKLEAKFLLIQYMFLKKTVFFKIDPFNIEGVPHDPITLATYCFMECQLYVKLLPNEKAQSLFSITWQQNIVRLLLQSAFATSELYLEIGSPRKAQYFIHQALHISQALLLTFWTSKILVLSGYIDLLCNDEKKCEVRLKALEYILKENENVKLQVPEDKHTYASPESDKLEENFLKTREDIDFKTKVRLDFLTQFEEMSISPVTHRRRNIIELKIKPQFPCRCQHCLYCAMNFVILETNFLQCFYLMEKKIFNDAAQHLNHIKVSLDHISKNADVIKELWLDCYQISSDVFHKNMPKPHAQFLTNIMIKQAICNFKTKNFENSIKIITEAESFLKRYSKSPFLSCPNLFSLVSFHKVIFLLKLMPMQNNQSMQDNFSLLLTPLSKACCTPNTQVPPIICTNNGGRSRILSMCNAPVKKSILPPEFKDALDNISSQRSSSEFQSPVLFDPSTAMKDEDAFMTPMIPPVKNTPILKKTTRSSRHVQPSHQSLRKKSDEQMPKEAKNYKFFPSKFLQTPSISASKSIWSQAETVFAFQCTTPLKKKHNRKDKCSERKAKSKGSNKLSSDLLQQNEKDKKKQPKSSSSENFNAINNLAKEEDDNVFDISAELFTSPPLGEFIEKSRNKPSRAHLNKCQKTSVSVTSHPVTSSSKPSSKTNKSETYLKLNKKSSEEIAEKPLSNSSSACSQKAKSSTKSSSSEISIISEFESHRNTIQKRKLKKQNTNSFSPEIATEDEFSYNHNYDITQLIAILKDAIAAIQHRPPYPLYADLCKILALLIMKHSSICDDDAFSIAYLLSESFAITLRNEHIINLGKKATKITSMSESSFSKPELNHFYKNLLMKLSCTPSGDLSFSDRMKELLNNLPDKWTIVQVCVIEEPQPFKTKSKQHLCISRYRKHAIPYTKLFDYNDDCDIKLFLAKFDEIRHENTVSTKASDVKTFWKLRTKLNKRLENFLNDMCLKWLGGWKGLFLGLPDNNKESESIVNDLLKSLHNKNKQEMVRVLVDSAPFLNKSELSSVICSLWNIEKTDETYDILYKCVHSISKKTKNVKRHPVILILDKNIQHLPWENIPIIKDNAGKNVAQAIVREPSLYFLNYQLSVYCTTNSLLSDGIDSRKTFYLLNPQGDMARTQETFTDIFSKKADWSGLIGEAPKPEEFYSALTDYDLFLYLGHGSGSMYIRSSWDIENLKCKAAAIVMGCNSGYLAKPGTSMEATGAAMKYYYLGECPCIVANLWEVTDKDIDLFTKSLLEMWLPNYNSEIDTERDRVSIDDAVAKARNSCFLRYLNGAAPVIYGLPLLAKL